MPVRKNNDVFELSESVIIGLLPLGLRGRRARGRAAAAVLHGGEAVRGPGRRAAGRAAALRAHVTAPWPPQHSHNLHCI